MSIVTSVVILGSILEDEPEIHAAMESFFANEREASHDPAHRTPRPMHMSGQRVGGWSALQGTLFAGAWNHLDDLAFLRHMRDAVPWRERETVRVLINREHDDHWHEVRLWPQLDSPAVLTLSPNGDRTITHTMRFE